MSAHINPAIHDKDRPPLEKDIPKPDIPAYYKLINRVVNKSIAQLMTHIATEHTQNKIEQ